MKTHVLSLRDATLFKWRLGFDWFMKNVGLSLIGLMIFVSVWQLLSGRIETSLGSFPGPSQVFAQWQVLVQEHRDEALRERAFYERQQLRLQEMRATGSDAEFNARVYVGVPTFFSQIATSLKTVFTGFLLSALIAIPLGLTIGLSGSVYIAVNPVIQLFRPVSPLAWLPLVTLVVSAVYIDVNPAMPKSFVTSAFTVMLCCVWPTVINTAVGVNTIGNDWKNVSRVLRLRPLQHLRHIVLPAAIPMMFTGLRLSLSTAWMVLIAAEMLSQNPGLGKFVWDEFQNGNSNSLGRIMVAVMTIGFIGFCLDRVMVAIQRRLSWDRSQTIR